MLDQVEKNQVDASEVSRRQFLQFMGRGSVAMGLTGAGLLGSSWLIGCASDGSLMAAKTSSPTSPPPPTNVQARPPGPKGFMREGPFQELGAITTDDLILADGFKYDVLIEEGASLGKGLTFGINNDFISYIPLSPKKPLVGTMWVNHEYPLPMLQHGEKNGKKKTREQVEMEMKSVGGSMFRVQKDAAKGKWIFKADSSNRRYDAFTPIRLIADRDIAGSKTAIGTFANCAGGLTPWQTFLSCEENYQDYYGEIEIAKDGKRTVLDEGKYGWKRFFNHPPEHYGWVVEINPKNGAAKKLTSMGRFAHEAATVILAKDGRPVVYMADDAENEFIYKFISKRKGSLEDGDLYVANTEKGQWLPIDFASDKRLQEAFQDRTDMLIQTRKAARIVGATPQDRPEDIEVDPMTGNVIVALTKNKTTGNNFGSLLKIVEKDSNPLALEFSSSVFMAGGQPNGFACPDNLVFDKKGNLWMVTDMSQTEMQSPDYERYGNNSMYYIPTSGPFAGQAFKVASAPKEAEISGPWFAPDNETLWITIQHPGETSPSPTSFTSHWPHGGDSRPRSSLVCISGPMMKKLIND